jgi:hypothetical protein
MNIEERETLLLLCRAIIDQDMAVIARIKRYDLSKINSLDLLHAYFGTKIVKEHQEEDEEDELLDSLDLDFDE